MRPSLILVLVFAIVASACEILAPQRIAPPDFETAAPAPTRGSEEEEFTRRAIEPAASRTQAPRTQAPVTQAPVTQAPRTQAPATRPPASRDPSERSDAGIAAALFLAQMLGDPLPEAFAREIEALIVAVPDRGPTPHSSASVPPRAPDPDTRITRVAALRLTLQKGMPAAAKTCGQGQGYLVVCPKDPDPQVHTDYRLMYQVTQAPIKVTADGSLATYAFALETDRSPANDFMPDPAFPNDFYAGTDRWYEVSKAPNGTWRLDITDPKSGQTRVRSGARAIIQDGVIFFLVPGSELAGPSPLFRATAFRHRGDFGMAPPHDWSGDLFPRVGEPLRPASDRTLAIPSR